MERAFVILFSLLELCARMLLVDGAAFDSHTGLSCPQCTPSGKLNKLPSRPPHWLYSDLDSTTAGKTAASPVAPTRQEIERVSAKQARWRGSARDASDSTVVGMGAATPATSQQASKAYHQQAQQEIARAKWVEAAGWPSRVAKKVADKEIRSVEAKGKPGVSARENVTRAAVAQGQQISQQVHSAEDEAEQEEARTAEEAEAKIAKAARVAQEKAQKEIASAQAAEAASARAAQAAENRAQREMVKAKATEAQAAAAANAKADEAWKANGRSDLGTYIEKAARSDAAAQAAEAAKAHAKYEEHIAEEREATSAAAVKATKEKAQEEIASVNRAKDSAVHQAEEAVAAEHQELIRTQRAANAAEAHAAEYKAQLEAAHVNITATRRRGKGISPGSSDAWRWGLAGTAVVGMLLGVEHFLSKPPVAQRASWL
eukprot:gnl/TRDRNA2_/TRDRNA2_82699_c0_seq2.p1 gnl/TRDRNA2_/TRDRNA2_82699_c0~~gnl/TRDRNA2_/TRDRNA2_82699_c0_seq2.p1  ORF type:complete len:431 (+),score=112.86 gnl/TRDRNA2_/TRDRNA2_82699_c0_seq2:54-1346(+)